MKTRSTNADAAHYPSPLGVRRTTRGTAAAIRENRDWRARPKLALPPCWLSSPTQCQQKTLGVVRPHEQLGNLFERPSEWEPTSHTKHGGLGMRTIGPLYLHMQSMGFLLFICLFSSRRSKIDRSYVSLDVWTGIAARLSTGYFATTHTLSF